MLEQSTQFESLYPAETRFEEIEKIKGFIKDGSSCQAVGIPGTGRSNLARLLAYNRNVRLKHFESQNIHFVYINMSEVKDRDLFDATKFIFLSIADSLRDRKLESEHQKAHSIFKEHLALNDEIALFQGLKELIDYLCNEKQMHIVFLLDRFEEYISKVNSYFFSNLKTIRNSAKYKFSSVFFANRSIEDLLDPIILSDYYELLVGKIVYLSVMDKAGVDFRISHLEKITGRKIDQKTKDEIINLTAGHGKLLRIAAELVISEEKTENLEEFLLLQKPIIKSLFEIWNSLTAEEQNNLIEGKTNEFLEKIGLTINSKITIPLFAKFVEKETSRFEKEDTITYDSKTNEIKKGPVDISDKLTSLEFRLLKYLIQNSEKLIEREEIISAVWKDAKSTAGVTDQAIDQLVFRLRKKIEENPNNPTHIQTIKGRGIKFNF